MLLQVNGDGPNDARIPFSSKIVMISFGYRGALQEGQGQALVTHWVGAGGQSQMALKHQIGQESLEVPFLEPQGNPNPRGWSHSLIPSRAQGSHTFPEGRE